MGAFPSVQNFPTILATLLVATAEAGRVFSTANWTSSAIKASMTPDRMENVILIQYELLKKTIILQLTNIAEELTVREAFNDLVKQLLLSGTHQHFIFYQLIAITDIKHQFYANNYWYVLLYGSGFNKGWCLLSLYGYNITPNL